MWRDTLLYQGTRSPQFCDRERRLGHYLLRRHPAGVGNPSACIQVGRDDSIGDKRYKGFNTSDVAVPDELFMMYLSVEPIQVSEEPTSDGYTGRKPTLSRSTPLVHVLCPRSFAY